MTLGIILLTTIAIGLAAAAGYVFIIFHKTGAFFDANGVRLHYIEAGRGTPLILVHGLAFSQAAEWRFPRLFQKLARRYRVIALDNRGHGKSEKPCDPECYGMEMVEDIVRLMDHLGIPKAHVLGYSLGGFITLKLLVRHPERLFSAMPCGAGWTPDPEKELAGLLALGDDFDQGRGFGTLIDWLQSPEKPLPPVIPGLVDRVLCWANNMKALSCVMRKVGDLVATEEELRGNTVPCLAIVGEHDRMRVFAEQMAAAMPNVELRVLPGRDHHSTLTHRDMLPTVMAFVDRHTA